MFSMQRNLKLSIAYDGTNYLGWQHNGVGLSIEGVLGRALETMFRHPVLLQAASRTDRGVHAEGQVVNFQTESPLTLYRINRGLNALLPQDIRVHQVEEVEDFHPTLDSTGKLYHYRLATRPVQMPHHRHLSWHLPLPLDLECMKTAAAQLVGTHDFSALANRKNDQTTNQVCAVEALTFDQWEGGVLIAIRGKRFLYKMVRNMVGLLVDTGRGRLSTDPAVILRDKNRSLAGVTAPAHGLTLYQVFYCPK